jgi:NAD(P)-dependent dehydrogenase (short-subunit alcohol dehydrogenase family)
MNTARAATMIGLLGGAAAIGLLAAKSARARCYSFRDKSVVITGASRGLGLAIARQLAREGAKLTLLARDETDLKNAADQLRAYDSEILTIPCDIRNQAEVEAAIGITMERFRTIDVLINNAGIIQVGPIDNIGIADFDDALATHMYGPLFTMLEVIPIMRKKGGGRIVNIASIGGKLAMPHMIPYCASKYALVGLSDGMRAELARDKIHVTTVCPWFMRTGSVYNIAVKGDHEKEFAWFAMGASIPGFTINADRAARKIIESCRRASPRLIMSGWGKAAALASELAPGTIARIQRITNALLPKPDFNGGDFPQTGWQSRSKLTPKKGGPLMQITRRAAVRNNEVRHAIHEARAAR